MVWDAINKGIFIPNDHSWKCRSCSFKRRCLQWHENEPGGRR
jgi:putative RecB family exonuclease